MSYYRGGGSAVEELAPAPLTKDLSEVNRVLRSMEPLGWRSYECFSTEFRLLEFSDPLAGLKGSIDEIIYLSLCL